MNTDDAFARMTSDVLTTFSGAQSVTFRGSSGESAVAGYVYSDHSFLGDDSPISQMTWFCALETSTINPVNGDEITDKNAQKWRLQERIESDEWMETWTVVKKY